MSNYVQLNNHIPTAAALFCGLVVATSYYQYDEEIQNEGYSFSSFSNVQTQYAITEIDIDSLQKMDVLHKFSSHMLSNVEDLDSEFSKVIDENYWELI